MPCADDQVMGRRDGRIVRRDEAQRSVGSSRPGERAADVEGAAGRERGGRVLAGRDRGPGVDVDIARACHVTKPDVTVIGASTLMSPEDL